MKTALDVDASHLDKHEKRFVENIKEYGWVVTHVGEGEGEPSFSYTTGFWLELRAPELIIFALPSELTHQIFWNCFNDLKEGKQFPIAEPISEVLDRYPVMLKPVLERHYANYFGWSRWFYGGDHFKVNQLFFPDKAGRFPWDDGESAEFKTDQPDLCEEK